MPLSRYQIRNEYNLADPELYKVADKDDPEALLEGVAMAGLVGVLRQLGDLAEFAAEVFHDLHEEVMATAARGHGLIVRVQQLEAEFPSVERTLLSQTSHTAFLYNSGIDWHQNARMDENVVTRGDLPRFVMDSYEECRGPPRLFLLDKFDVAGAGACLKRFTDPSFFKAEATSSTGKKLDAQREKRTRRVKRRGPRWRNEATPETFPSSHAKLHQLFLEEVIETGGNDPDRRVKLKKRQFTGSLFDEDKRKGYMEKFLDSCSPEQRIVHEVCIDALPLTWTSDNGCESGLEIVEIGTDSPLKESMQSSPDIREMVVRPSLEAFSEGELNDITKHAVQEPRFSHDSDGAKISSASYKVRSEVSVDRQSKSEVSDGDGGNSAAVDSEIDNYMDALANMESEIETDSECSNNQHYLHLKPIVVDSDASEGLRRPHSLFLDSQSLGSATASEDGNHFFKERQSSSRSMSAKSLAESTPYLNAAVATVSSARPCNLDADNRSLERHSASEDVLESETECRMSAASVEANEISKTVQESGNGFNHLNHADLGNTKWSVDVGATQSENLLPSSVDKLCFAEPDMLSGASYPGHDNQTNSNSLVRTVLDAPERTERGQWSSAQQPMHDSSSHSLSVSSESLLDPETTHDSLTPIEHKKADSASSNEDRDNAFDQEDESAISDPNVPEMMKTLKGASNLDFRATSKEDNSNDWYSGSGSRWKSNDQEQSEMTTLSHMPSPYYAEAAASLPSSQQEYSIKEVTVDVEDEEKVSSALMVGQSENSPLPISSELQIRASGFPFYGTTNATAETAEHGSLEAAISGEVSWAESNGDLPSKSADAETVSFDRDVCEDVSFQSNKQNLVEAVEHLDKTESQAVQADSASDRDFYNVDDDKRNAFSHDEFPCDRLSKLPGSFSSVSAAEGDSCQLHGMERLEHKQTGTDDYSQPDVNGSLNENFRLSSSSSSSLCPEKVQGQPASVNEDHYQSEQELANVQSGIKFDVTATPSTSEDACQDHDSTLPHHMHLLERTEESMGSCSQNLSGIVIPQEKGLVLHNDESPSQPLLANKQSQNPECVNKEENSAALHDHGQSLMPNLLAQPAVHVLGGYTQHMAESTSSSGDNVLSGTNQTAQVVDISRQPIQTEGFPVLGMLPAEPQINLDSPPLPPLPPMQWRLSRFQGSSAADERRMVQHLHAPVQPTTLLGYDHETDPSSLTSNYLGQPGFSNDSAEVGNLQPLPVPASEVSLENGMDEIQKQELPVANSVSTRSLNGTQMSVESYQSSVDSVELKSLVNHPSGDDSLVTEAKVGGGNDVQNQFEQIPKVTEQEAASTHVPFLQPSAMHYEWQAPPSLMAPEARRTWLSAYEGMPTDEVLYANGVQQKKPPRPRNPLIDEVVAIDKSKLRKVERVKPSVESKSEGGESFLEQLQLRKVERVKASTESKTQEGESLLEQLQLRKVGERVKPAEDPKSELKTDRELPLEHIQLRKVGERVKSEAELKAEETDSLRVQLRKTSDRVKVEGEQKLEETESPKVQLRKVSARVKQEVQQKPEETESPRVQLRKVSETVKQEVHQKPEETESPRVQLRRVGQTAAPSIAPKTEERDSIMEQIRNKSFSLKPAVATRPNIQGIQGPRTNLKVAAIIEKASTIRQAMAGSDEDEEDDADNWSDC